MVEIKPMSYSEKYTKVLDGLKHDEFVPGFIEKHLGAAAAAEYRQRCEAGMQPIPENASDETKYEIAYKNWMSTASAAFGFVRERMGQAGIDQMAQVSTEALIRENANPSLLILRLVRALSAGKAFEMVAKKSAYELQYLVDYSVEELDERKAVFQVPHCKVKDFPDAADVCTIGCRREYPQWMAEQLHVKMEGRPHQDDSCTLTFTPIE